VSSGLAAIAVIVVGIVLLNLLQSSPGASSNDLVGAPDPRLTGAAPPSPPGTATPTTRPSRQPAKPSPAASAPATRPGTSAGATLVTRQPLTVLNHSRRAGLASRAAAQFDARGWPIHLVGNTTYRARMTTVYYVPGQEAAARRLMSEFPGVRRMLLRPLRLPGRGLTVVVTRDYPA
jgi:hypothetical protein